MLICLITRAMQTAIWKVITGILGLVSPSDIENNTAALITAAFCQSEIRCIPWSNKISAFTLLWSHGLRLLPHVQVPNFTTILWDKAHFLSHLAWNKQKLLQSAVITCTYYFSHYSWFDGYIIQHFWAAIRATIHRLRTDCVLWNIFWKQVWA